MDKLKIGTNAGVVWNSLDEKREGMSFDELLRKAELSVADLAAAIGWLSREDKIWCSSAENGTEVYSVHQSYYF